MMNFCIKNEEVCIQNEEFCIQNEGRCIKMMNSAGPCPARVIIGKGLGWEIGWAAHRERWTRLIVRFLLKNLHFSLKNVDFLLKNVDFMTKRPSLAGWARRTTWRSVFNGRILISVEES